MEAIKQKSNHKNEHNALFIWHRFDISRSVFKDFIRITFVVMENEPKWVLCVAAFSGPQNLIIKYKTTSFELLT